MPGKQSKFTINHKYCIRELAVANLLYYYVTKRYILFIDLYAKDCCRASYRISENRDVRDVVDEI